MSYQNELTRLQQIITSDDSTAEQRTTARYAREKLIEDAIAEAFIVLEARTENYGVLLRKLNGVVNSIEANELTGVAERVTAILGELNSAATS